MTTATAPTRTATTEPAALEELVYGGEHPDWVHLVEDEDDEYALCGEYVGDDVADWTLDVDGMQCPACTEAQKRGATTTEESP